MVVIAHHSNAKITVKVFAANGDGPFILSSIIQDVRRVINTGCITGKMPVSPHNPRKFYP